MKCHYKGNSYMDKQGRIRTPICKKYGNKCIDESNCDYIKNQEKVLRKQK